jgi:hypothetical protein
MRAKNSKDLAFLWGDKKGDIVLKISSPLVILKQKTDVLVNRLGGVKSLLIAIAPMGEK